METCTFISIEKRRVEESIHFTTYRQPRGLNQGNMPLHLTPSHFRRQQRNTRGHTLAGRTARWTRPLTGNSQVPAAKKTQVSHCSRTGPAQPPKKTASTQIAVVAHFQTEPATQNSSSQIAVVAVAFVCHQKNKEFADCSCSPVGPVLPTRPATKKNSSSQIAVATGFAAEKSEDKVDSDQSSILVIVALPPNN